MWTDKKAFHNKKPNTKKLSEYGFIRKGDVFIYSEDILNNSFVFSIYVTEGEADMKVTDRFSGDEYTLVSNPNATGAFVGSVRRACEEITADILEKCFEDNIFKEKQTKEVITYVREKYGSKVEHLWEDTPNNGAIRNGNTGKWYAALLTVKRSKIGLDGDEEIEVINLKAPPEVIEKIVDGKNYFLGYHMNKKHWYTVPLNGTLTTEEIFRCIDTSYDLIDKKRKAK